MKIISNEENTKMKKIVISLVLVFVVCGMTVPAGAVSKDAPSGEALFIANCKVCHPDGGNIINPAKTLHKKDRAANSIKTADDIIKTMRNPGPGMTKFDEKMISNSNAKAIAEYILKTF